MTLALTSKALERVGVPPIGSAFSPIVSPLVVLSLVATYCSSCPMAGRCAVAQRSWSKTSPAVMGAGVASSTPVCLSPPMASVWGYLGCWLGCCPALSWSGWPSIWQSGTLTLWYPPQGQWSWQP